MERRGFLKALLGAPLAVPMIAEALKKPEPKPPVIDDLLVPHPTGTTHTVTTTACPHYVCRGDLKPRIATLARRHGPKDRTIVLRGDALKDIPVGTILLFKKTGMVESVRLRVEPGVRIVGVAVDETVLPVSRVSSFRAHRYTLAAGDEGIVIGSMVDEYDPGGFLAPFLGVRA
jgi:hypothetical protein